MVWQWLKTVGKAVVEVGKLVFPYVKPIIDEIFVDDRALVEQRENIEVTQLKLQYVQHQENIDFQKDLAKLSQQRAKELEEFIQRAEDARLQKNLDFQVWRLEQEKALQLQLLELNHQLQRELVTYQRQTSIKVVEEQKRLENSPIWLVASDILNSHPKDEIMPLRVFFAPPKLQFERFANAASAAKIFPDIELTLAEGLRQFFRNYSTQGRPLDFLAGAWVSKSFHSEASIKALFGVLKSEPTLVLESEVDGDYLNFRIAYWGLNWSKYRYEPVISRLPYQDILYEAAKTRARKWPETRAKLIATGISAEEADQVYGKDNVKNWEILQREERFRQVGIDASEVEINYIVNKKDFEELCQFLIIYHCVFAGMIADEYFIFQYNLPPLLPQLLPGLTENVPDTEAVQEMIKSVVVYYENLYQALGSQRSGWVAELALDLAQSLAHLPNKSWAKARIAESLKSWLKLRGLNQPDGFEALLEAVESVLTIADLAYVQKVNECLAAAGENCFLNVMDACYKRGMKRCQQEDYQAAISAFDQAIQINSSWADAYYNRGLAYAKLGEAGKAIDDYDRTLKINSNWADAYNNRGNAHYKLGNYEKAIEDYDRTLSINPNFTAAARNRDIAQGVWDEVKRQQQEEEDALTQKQNQEAERKRQELEKPKRSLENASVVYTLTGHSSAVRSLAISPDGQTLASGSEDHTIEIWQLGTGKKLRTLTGHSNSIYSLAISPDGQTLASGSSDKTIKIWQLSTGKLLHTLTEHNDWVYCLAISPSGMLISGSDDATIKIWNLSMGREIRTLKGHSGWVRSLAVSPDGEICVSGSADRTITIWQLSNGQQQKLRTLIGHSGMINCLAITPDGKTLVSGSGDETIKSWDLSSGQQLRTFLGHSNVVLSLAISPDGQRLISNSIDTTVKVWHLNTGQLLRTHTAHSKSVMSVAISPDGQTLVTGSEDKTIKIWRVL